MKIKMWIGVGLLLSGMAHASIVNFGTGGNQFQMEFVDIGYAGNDAQSSANRSHTSDVGDGKGAVGYGYQIGKFEVTIDQLLKADALDSRIDDGEGNYWNNGTQTLGVNAPASMVNVVEAKRFCNWLTSGNAALGAYSLDGTTTDRDTAIATYGTVYVVPTVDEWFKAAYYNGADDGYYLYANGTDSAPASGVTGANYNNSTVWTVGSGAMDQNGTYDMMGNVWERTEDGTGRWGGAYDSTSTSLRSSDPLTTTAGTEWKQIGFRVVAIPEPATLGLLGAAIAGLLVLRRVSR